MKYYIWNVDGKYLNIIEREGLYPEEVMREITRIHGVGCMFQSVRDYEHQHGPFNPSPQLLYFPRVISKQDVLLKKNGLQHSRYDGYGHGGYNDEHNRYYE